MSNQSPLGTGFGRASTTSDVIKGIDLRGKIAIVTGANAGLGQETARTLAGAGAHVIAAVRDVKNAQRTLAGVDGLEFDTLDLIDSKSIAAFAERFLAPGRALDILVNNAGIFCRPFALDSRGIESHFAVNHLGHFELTTRLWPALVKANGARVVTVSSLAHRIAPVSFEDINFERREYQPILGYAQSKTANALFAVELGRRGRDQGVRAFAVHPGVIVETDIIDHLSDDEKHAIGEWTPDGRPVIDPASGYKSIPQGAATAVWCATSPLLEGLGGVYCESSDIAPVVSPELVASWGGIAADPSHPAGVMPHAIDPVAAQRLWTLSEELTGTRLSQSE